MTISQRVENDLKEAMKAKNEQQLSTLRLVRSAFKNRQIEAQCELTDEDAVAVLRTMVKQYRDALSDFVAAARQDLVDKQTEEIRIIEKYLPPMMSEADLEIICVRVIKESNAAEKDLGKVMGAVMKEVQGRADGGMVRTIVTRLLSTSQK